MSSLLQTECPGPETKEDSKSGLFQQIGRRTLVSTEEMLPLDNTISAKLETQYALWPS